MTRTDESLCPFRGRYLVESDYLNAAAIKLSWEFFDVKIIDSEAARIIFDGKLKEVFSNGSQEITEFSYYPYEKLLYIDRSSYNHNGFCNICINDRYHVLAIRNNVFHLFDMEHIDNVLRLIGDENDI